MTTSQTTAPGPSTDPAFLARLRAATALLEEIDRPPLPDRAEVHDVAAVLHWIGHAADRGV